MFTDQSPLLSTFKEVSFPNCPETFTSLALGAIKRKVTEPSESSSGEMTGARRGGVEGLELLVEEVDWEKDDDMEAIRMTQTAPRV